MLPGLAAAAAAGGGTFSRQDALAAGYTPAEIRAALASRTWVRLRRGRYAESATLSRPDVEGPARPGADLDLRRFRMASAAALAAHPGSTLSHGSAALLHGLDVHPAMRARSLETVEVILRAGNSRRRPGLLGHDLPLGVDEIVMVDGLPLTSPARTCVDVAAVAPTADAVILTDSLLRRWAVTGVDRLDAQEHLLSVADRWPRRHHRRMHRVIAFADGASESGGESLSRVVLAALGIEAPQLQYLVGRYRADFGWPLLGTLGEFDGRSKYTDPQVLWDEKRREDELRAAGWEVARWTWSEITEAPDQVADRLRRAFARGSRRAG